MATVLTSARIDASLKEDAEKILNSMGITGSEFIRLCYSQVRTERKLPFVPSASEIPNDETIKAIRDVEEGQNLITCNSLSELIKDLLS